MNTLEPIDPQRQTMILASNLRYLRKLNCITQADLAKSANVKQPYLARVESGNSGIRLTTIVKLANTLQVPLEELLTPKWGNV